MIMTLSAGWEICNKTIRQSVKIANKMVVTQCMKINIKTITDHEWNSTLKLFDKNSNKKQSYKLLR